MKFQIVTDQKWVREKIPAVKFLLSLSPDLENVTFDVRDVSLAPEVKDGRITETWFQENITREAITKGYTGSVFLASEKDGKRWKLKDGLRGSYFNDGDGFMECWVVSDEDSVVKFKDGTERDKTSKTIPHELGHGFKELGYTDLEIHDYDYKNSINNIEGFYVDFRIRKDKLHNLKQQLSIWQRILFLLGLQKRGEYDYILPIPEKYWNRPSQEYGVGDKRYKLTGVHIGLDLPCPVGTPIKARMNGKIIKVGQTAALGHYCHFEFVSKGVTYVDRYLHLKERPTPGEYKQGDVLAFSGATGQVTGPHLHIDTWINRVDITKINSANWPFLTVDPRKI